jgi:hypothetical protein
MFAFVAGALATTGCNPTTESPTGVLQLAVIQVQKQNVSAFTKTLTGVARDEYGSAQGLARVSQKLSQYSQFQAGPETLISTQSGPDGRDAGRLYSVDVEGNRKAGGTVVLKTRIDCQITWYPPIGHCTRRDCIHWKDIPDCRISDIQFE